MNDYLTSITLGTSDTLWTLRKQNPRLLPTRIGLGGLNMSLTEPPSVPPEGGKPRAATTASPPLQRGFRGAPDIDQAPGVELLGLASFVLSKTEMAT